MKWKAEGLQDYLLEYEANECKVQVLWVKLKYNLTYAFVSSSPKALQGGTTRWVEQYNVVCLCLLFGIFCYHKGHIYLSLME